MENFNHILLFKTNIACDADKALLGEILKNRTGIEQWTVDLDDEDRVLRIVSHTLCHQHIIDLINYHGYNCCELT